MSPAINWQVASGLASEARRATTRRRRLFRRRP